MFKHLLVLLLIAATLAATLSAQAAPAPDIARLSVSPPAQASTLNVEMWCQGFDMQPFYVCQATASGGTGSYTSYKWKIQAGAYAPTYTTTSTPRYDGSCSVKGMPYTVTVTVADSRRATASASSSFRCMMDEY